MDINYYLDFIIKEETHKAIQEWQEESGSDIESYIEYMLEEKFGKR